MRRGLHIISIIICVCLLSPVEAQQQEQSDPDVQAVNGFVGLQVGIPSAEMQRAIRNRMGNLGFGLGVIVLSDPGSWGAHKRNSSFRLGGELGYSYYGRFLSDVNINGYEGSYKTSYGLAQLNAVIQVRPPQLQRISPFVDLIAGGNFYLSRTKENLNAIESALGIQSFEIDSYASVGFNKGIAAGFSFGDPDLYRAPRLTIRLSYNMGSDIRYVVRNSLIYNPGANRLEYQVGRAPVRYFMAQLGVSF